MFNLFVIIKQHLQLDCRSHVWYSSLSTFENATGSEITLCWYNTGNVCFGRNMLEHHVPLI